jgi:hypothetical protein
MQNPIEKKDNRRSCQRFTILLKAQYYFENNHSYRDCTIIDVSRSGAAIMLPKDENAAKGNTIFLEIVKGLESISLRGSLVWVSLIENGYLAGIRFNKLLDMNTLQLLG